MELNLNRMSDILINHVGYEPKAVKKFVYTGLAAETFSVKRLNDAIYTEVYSGKLKYIETDPIYGTSGYVGDFSPVTEEGVYRIYCGDVPGRTFSICNNVYGPAYRIMSQFFVWQRCGDDTGWNGPCHMNEKLIDKKGVTHHFHGGHHQSGDLRKWKFGAPYGVYQLSEFLKLGNPLWNKGQIEYDIAHSVKYYLSLISDEGYIFDSVFVPYDYDEAKCRGKGYCGYKEFWKDFMYHDRPTSQVGHTNVICLLASASVTLKNYDLELSKRCLDGALKVWSYMMKKGRYVGDFDWEIYPPIGHDRFRQMLFDYYFEDSAAMLTCCSMAGMELYKATGDKAIMDETAEMIRKLAKLHVVNSDGSLDYIKMSETDGRPQESQWYAVTYAPIVYATALEVFAGHEDEALWKRCAEQFLLRCEKTANGNLFGKTTNFMRKNPDTGEYFWSFRVPSGNKELADTAVFMSKISHIFGKERCLGIAQRHLDWIMGANHFDSSAIENVGYNQPMRACFGEFTPMQPQMPGGVFTELGPDHYDKGAWGTEYDLPITGAVLYALKCYETILNRD